ncbi:hypothetical protein [Polyangium mundeleinium]|uniref:Kazal-like domain-containing protein n=1 Tax=Polyangium mundeleinium TaxID=2995306 RepID=A0ABT5EUX0_9BACT|nr:hypothetical protein [Polyangium mundeleinium]MDC0745613.1 hypothetical protein [Polyangium mundeleinium]
MRITACTVGLFFLLLTCAAPACTESAGDSPSSTSTGASSGGGGEGGAAGGGAGGGSASSSSSGGQGGAGGPKSCDGTYATWCGNNVYCDAPEGTCPGGGVLGTCTPRPKDCAGASMAITCGCNGQVYINACEVYRSGVDVGSQDGCQAPADPFACGPVLCENGTEYCERINFSHRCKPLPAACQSPDAMCGCLDDVLCGAAPGLPECMKDANGHFFVTCIVTE